MITKGMESYYHYSHLYCQDLFHIYLLNRFNKIYEVFRIYNQFDEIKGALR